jgi:hypothetical protein
MVNRSCLLLVMALFASACTVDRTERQEAAMHQYALNIRVDTFPVPTDEKTEMIMQLISSDTTSYPGWIERRGGYSISFPKFSYEIDLETDIPLGGLPADDDWILNSNYIDKTFLRHVLSYELFRAMHPNNRAPLCSYLPLYINSSYAGLYVLMEKIDRSSLGIHKKDPAAFIFKEPPLFRPDWSNFVAQKEDNFFQQTYPKKTVVDKTAEMDVLRDWVMNSPDSSFLEKCTVIFDLANVIDWHLLLLLSNNSDGILKNFYLYKVSAETPIRIAPWDYDHSFGRDGDNELNLIRPLRIEISAFFKRLLTFPAYKKALANRWEELNEQDLFTPSSLKERMHGLVQTFQPLLAANFARWPVDGPHYYDNNDFEQELALMEQFIDLRHEQLQIYFTEVSR